MNENREVKSTPTQHARFIETARQIGCDEDEAAFNEKLKAVVGPKINKGDHGTPAKD